LIRKPVALPRFNGMVRQNDQGIGRFYAKKRLKKMDDFSENKVK